MTGANQTGGPSTRRTITSLHPYLGLSGARVGSAGAITQTK